MAESWIGRSFYRRAAKGAVLSCDTILDPAVMTAFVETKEVAVPVVDAQRLLERLGHEECNQQADIIWLPMLTECRRGEIFGPG